MKVLILGSGGRECALAWRMSQDEVVKSVIVAPGNPGMLAMSDKIELNGAKTKDEYLELAKREAVDLAVVGPENLLVDGIVDLFQSHNIPIVGPNAECARLEGSKIFSKMFMKEAGIPTARFAVKENYERACELIDNWPFSQDGFVIKADGLAGGKGVVVTKNASEAKSALFDFMENDEVSITSQKILIEEVLKGKEMSFFALCDDLDYMYLGCARDHKRLLDNDLGPNTGGMGCIGSKNLISVELREKIENRILKPTLKSFHDNKIPYKGFLFIGLMIDDNNDPYVIEYNVRMGDPETQTLMPLLKGDFFDGLFSCAKGELNNNRTHLSLTDKASVHVVATSKGYPDLKSVGMVTGGKVSGLEAFSGKATGDDAKLFCAGVKQDGDHLINSGGRVLGVTAMGESLKSARSLAYEYIEKISFEGMFYRKDIGAREVDD